MALAFIAALGLVLLAAGPALATCPPFCGRSPSESSRPPMVRPPMVPRPPAAEALRRQQELRQAQQRAKDRFNKFKGMNDAFFRDRLAFFRDRFAFRDRFEFRSRVEREAKRQEVQRRTFANSKASREDIQKAWAGLWTQARQQVSAQADKALAAKTKADAAFAQGHYLYEKGNNEGALAYLKEAQKGYSDFLSIAAEFGVDIPKELSDFVASLGDVIDNFGQVQQRTKSDSPLQGKAFSSKADAMLSALEYGGGDTGKSFRYLETARNADPNDPIVGEALNDMRSIFGAVPTAGP
jgi:tetratricopeptide (TPR) repeat protein